MAQLIIDRFEEDLAIIEKDGETFIEVLRSLLPSDAKEGDCLKLVDGVYLIDAETTQARAATIAEKMRRLFVD